MVGQPLNFDNGPDDDGEPDVVDGANANRQQAKKRKPEADIAPAADGDGATSASDLRLIATKRIRKRWKAQNRQGSRKEFEQDVARLLARLRDAEAADERDSQPSPAKLFRTRGGYRKDSNYQPPDGGDAV
jgi:hypothetical protein